MMIHATLTVVTCGGYGDAVVCDDAKFSSEYEKVCMCGIDGTFECPVPCPDAPLVEGAPCSPFANNGYCNYGEFCCPDEASKCIPAMRCRCTLQGTVRCTNTKASFNFVASLDCPSACPQIPPSDADLTLDCDFDPRFKCGYGDARVCDGEPGAILFTNTIGRAVVSRHRTETYSLVQPILAIPVVLKFHQLLEKTAIGPLSHPNFQTAWILDVTTASCAAPTKAVPASQSRIVVVSLIR
jgi:hypothetical protein